MFRKGNAVKSVITGKKGIVVQTRVNIANRPGWEDQSYVLFDDAERGRWVFDRNLQLVRTND